MTDDEVISIYNDMVAWYGKPVPSFEHELIQFAYLVKLYKYYKSKN